MGLLDVLRMAVPDIAAARTGYLQGQDQEEDKQRGMQRQSMLDQLKAAMDQSTIEENRARASYYNNGGQTADDMTYLKVVNPDGSISWTAVPKKIRGGGTVT